MRLANYQAVSVFGYLVVSSFGYFAAHSAAKHVKVSELADA
jgi:hypothetical protein